MRHACLVVIPLVLAQTAQVLPVFADCIGDLDDDGTVRVAELVELVNCGLREIKGWELPVDFEDLGIAQTSALLGCPPTDTCVLHGGDYATRCTFRGYISRGSSTDPVFVDLYNGSKVHIGPTLDATWYRYFPQRGPPPEKPTANYVFVVGDKGTRPFFARATIALENAGRTLIFSVLEADLFPFYNFSGEYYPSSHGLTQRCRISGPNGGSDSSN